jgi:plasmid stabilization system protein ParE
VAQVTYSALALQDLERIVEFLLHAAPASAEATLRQVQSAIEILSPHPRIGRRARSQLRELVISVGASGYVALYRYDPALDLVRIVRVRHQREAGHRD